MKKILFRPVSELAETSVDKPVPAKNYLPEWYKKIPKFINGKFEPTVENLHPVTLKSCVPFMDALTNGYIQETWCDIHIKLNQDGISYVGSSQIPPMKHRNDLHFPINDNYVPIEFTWLQQWIPQMPRGYSMLYTHPLNRYDLPFLCLDGIIDNDTFYGAPNDANYPFYIKKGFEGIIPKGTPLYQMIPIKRESWKAEYAPYNKKINDTFKNVGHFFYDGYKKLYWNQKVFK